MSTPLSSRLRTETKTAHTAAERSGIMRRLLRGTIDRNAYLALLSNLAVVYETMELELARLEGTAFTAFSFPLVARAPALAHDIARFEAAGAEPSVIQPATHAYAAHLRTLGERAPELLVAHAYLRYLGDMYGGQIIRSIVEKTFGDDVTDATAFYDFERIADLGAFKNAFRSAIDSLPSAESMADAIVAEAQLGYEFHERMFTELDTDSEVVTGA